MATSSEEQPRENAPHPPEAVQSAPPSRRGLIAGAAALCVIVIVFATLFYTLSHKGPSTATAAPSPTAPTGWQRYTDPDGFFSVSIPDGWTVKQADGGSLMMGDGSGSVTLHNIMDTLGGPPGGQNSITLWVMIEPLPDDLARQWACQAWGEPPTTTTIAGLPAVHFMDNSWLLTTSAAHFQIDYAYPNWQGDRAILPDSPTATPMPPGFYDLGQQEIQTIIASFQPIPATPLACK